jgi:hypothetical protein
LALLFTLRDYSFINVNHNGVLTLSSPSGFKQLACVKKQAGIQAIPAFWGLLALLVAPGRFLNGQSHFFPVLCGMFQDYNGRYNQEFAFIF